MERDDQYHYLDKLGRTEAERTLWQRVKRIMVGSDEAGRYCGLLQQQLQRLCEDCRLYQTGSVLREPLTLLSVNLRQTVEQIDVYMAAAARAAAERETAPLARKSTARPTRRELEKMQSLAEARSRQQESPSVLVPGVFNQYYTDRLSSGDSWQDLSAETLRYGPQDESALEASTRRMLQLAAEQSQDVPEFVVQGGQNLVSGDTSESSGGRPQKRTASRAERTESVAHRLRSASSTQRGGDVGLTTWQLRQRSKHRQEEAVLTQQLNQIADDNMAARLKAKQDAKQTIMPQPSQASGSGSGSGVKPEEQKSGENQVEVSVAEKPWPTQLPKIAKTEPKAETKAEPCEVVLQLPRGVPANWVMFRYTAEDVDKKMVRLNLRLYMELEATPRLLMIDPWSSRSVSGIPQIAAQVEVNSPTVFQCEKTNRITSTRKSGPAYILVFDQEVRVTFRTPRRQEMVVYLGYVQHLRGMVVFGVDFLKRYGPSFVLDPTGTHGFMLYKGERIPVEAVRNCLKRPDEERELQERERQEWATQ